MKTLTHLTKPEPCKPRRGMTQADKRPQVYRPGALESATLPRIEGSWRIWPDGRREKVL